MKLDINGRIVANPAASDIASALDARGDDKDWYLVLTRPDGLYIEVEPSGTGDMLRIAHGDEEEGTHRLAPNTVTTGKAKSILGDFLAGGAVPPSEPREEAKRAEDKVLAGREEFSQRTLGFVILFVGLGFGLLYLTQSMLVFFAFIGLGLLVMVGTKAAREMRVRRWPIAAGTIVKSNLQARVRKFRGQAARLDNIPAVEYRFKVSGKPYIGTRIGLNTEYAGVDVGALVTKYPVGAAVQVAYNPANPVDCLLEPYANKGILLVLLKFAAGVAVLGAVLYYGPGYASAWISERFPDARAPQALLGFGIGTLLLVVNIWSLMRKKEPAVAALRVPGKIASAEVETIVPDDSSDSRRRSRPTYQPTIEISYGVRGLDYTLRTAIPDGQAAEHTPEAAKARLKPYSVGGEVPVSYDPANPAAASIAVGADSPVAGGGWSSQIFRMAVIIGCFAIGAHALGLY